MNKYLEEYGKGAAKKFGELSVTSLIAGLALFFPQVQNWAKHLWLSEAQITIIRWCLLGVSLLSAIIALYVHIFRKLRDTQASLRENQQLLRDQQEREKATFQAIHQVRAQEPQRPSERAFHVLKWFDLIGPLRAANVQTVAQACRMSHEDALEAVKELWSANYIHTVEPGAGEWNGIYCVTGLGSECVGRFAT